MTDISYIGIDSEHWGEAVNVLHALIFDILLMTDGRTTDILETLLDEKMIVHVIRQEQINESHSDLTGEASDASYYIRESVLVGDKSHFIVSHNIALVYSKHVPPPLFEKIARRKEGIGKSINSMALQTYRKVVDYGQKAEEEAVDLLQNPLKLRFPQLHEKVPYKRYWIYFGNMPGIQILEYFNPELLRHRITKAINDNLGGIHHE